MSTDSTAPRVPSYRRHRPSGQAVVTLNGCDCYLGKWNTKASRPEYDRLIGEWLAGGRCLPRGENGDLTIAELALRYWRFAKGYYRKDGHPTSELAEYKALLRLMRERYGATPARAFGPLALKAVRQCMIDAGLARGVINRRVNRIANSFQLRPYFKWLKCYCILERIFRSLIVGSCCCAQG